VSTAHLPSIVVIMMVMMLAPLAMLMPVAMFHVAASFLAFYVVHPLFDDRRRLNINWFWLYIDRCRRRHHRYSDEVDHGAAPLHRPVSRPAIGHPVANNGTGHRANCSRHRTPVSTTDLIAEDAASKTADNGTAKVGTSRLDRNLFIPALLTRTLDSLILGCASRERECKDGEGTEQHFFDILVLGIMVFI
jgi:hypothetical protein